MKTSTNQNNSTTSSVSNLDIYNMAKNSTAFFASRMNRAMDPEEIADATQDICVKILTSRKPYDPAKSRKSTWISSIAHNHVCSVSKEKTVRKRREIPIKTTLNKDDTGTLSIDIPDAGLPDRRLMQNDFFKAFYEIYDSLDITNQRILCRHIQGVERCDIAEEMGLSYNAVSLRIFYIKKKLEPIKKLLAA